MTEDTFGGFRAKSIAKAFFHSGSLRRPAFRGQEGKFAHERARIQSSPLADLELREERSGLFSKIIFPGLKPAPNKGSGAVPAQFDLGVVFRVERFFRGGLRG